MNDSITIEQVKTAIKQFLEDKAELPKYEKKLEQAKKTFAAAEGSGNAQAIEKANSEVEKAEKELSQRKAKFELEQWMEFAASSMAKSLNLCTHLSKGVHPSSKGDNVRCDSQMPLPIGYVGTQQLESPELDASGGATVLPLAGLLRTKVIGETTILDLLLSSHSALDGAFSSDVEKSRLYAQRFKMVLREEPGLPRTDALNKQLLVPMSIDAQYSDSYINLVPLHPSSLTNYVYQNIQQRFSNENKEARENRKKKNVRQQPYFSFADLAKIKLGGSNPQNVSSFLTRSGGANFLLPSRPPVFKSRDCFKLSKSDGSFFNKRLYYCCRDGFELLISVIDSPASSNMNLRKLRTEGLGSILNWVLATAVEVQQESETGWTKNFSRLSLAECRWLDPQRNTVDEEFARQCADVDWIKVIQDNFALWVNKMIEQYSKKSVVLGDVESKEWKKLLKDYIKASLRSDEALFEGAVI